MSQELKETQYCQSCGMPLRFDVEEYLGTNKDNSRSDEYCYYCLKEGEYIVDISMEEMIDIWVKYTDKYNEYSDTNLTPSELREILDKRMPTLKRWKQKETTKNIHYETISRIKTYIDGNLFCDIDTERLSELSNLSLFHFRRVFKSITGENIGDYIQRLRLESIAHSLISTELPAKDILKHTNYQTKSSLSKAFKKHFGISMLEYRKIHKNTPSKEDSSLVLSSFPIPKIKKMVSQKVLCHPVEDSFRDMHKYMNIWKKLVRFRDNQVKNKGNTRFVSISLDNPLITSAGQCRFYLGIITTEDIRPKAKFGIQEIPGGLYAIFRHTGNYARLPELYQFIQEKWLPDSNYSQSHPLSFEIYLNTPKEVEINNLITDVYIPLKKKKE